MSRADKRLARMRANPRDWTMDDYAFEIRPLSAADGGGYLITFPDLPGCMSDGATPEEAIANGRDAFLAWMAASEEEGLAIPGPGEGGESGRFVTRVPKSLHARLRAAARREGVSMNTLVVSLLAAAAGAGTRPAASRETGPAASECARVGASEARARYDAADAGKNGRTARRNVGRRAKTGKATLAEGGANQGDAVQLDSDSEG